MSYLRGFIPWIAFAVVSSFGWQWGALAGLVLGVLLLGENRVKKVPLDTQVLEISTIVFFVALAAYAFAATNSPVEHYDGALSMAWLALTAGGSLAVGQPFTLGIAKRQTPPEVWDSPVFRRINVVITSAWSVAFAVTAIALAALAVADADVLARVLVQVAGFVVPAVFTARYPERVRARYAEG